MLDVYVCSNNHDFAVKSDQEPEYCPFCGTQEIDFSHYVERGEGLGY